MRAQTTSDSDIEQILGRIRRQEGVRHPLTGGGVLSIDHGLPYLLVHRQPEGVDDAGTARLVSGEASYLLASREGAGEVPALTARLAEAGSTAFGAFLVLELWAARDPASTRFVLHGPAGPAPETVETLAGGLRTLLDLHHGLDVELRHGDDRHPPGLPPLLSVKEGWRSGILLLGLELPPVYRDPATGEVYPRFLRRLQARLSDVLRQALYEFIRVQTNCKVENYRALGTRMVPDSVWRTDRELAAIERSFSFLLLVSPVNQEGAWERFREDGFERDPVFHYRLLPIDPDLLKRRLFAVPIEEIDDPALASLFQDKRQELDKQLGMLDERGQPAFRHSSMRLYGTTDERLLSVAGALLESVPPPEPRRPDAPPAPTVDALAFRDAALREVAHYAARSDAITTRRVEVRPDVVGLMVSEGNLLIGEGLRLSPARVPALIHHEVGTHVLTYVNGRAQPMEQLSLGLADYDELQEGLAVLAEYLVGGLDRSRMRVLAARVVAAHAVEQGATFVDTFRLLTGHGFSRHTAWGIAVRVQQCGGFTRDLIYLRGLIRLLDHLATGGELARLYLGKLAQKHVPILEELRHRGVLREPPLTPRFLDDPEARARLEVVRRGITLSELICPESE